MGMKEDDMAQDAQWTKEAYEASITSRAWRFTKYEDGWDGCSAYGVDLPGSAELRAIFQEEMRLENVPEWAEEIIRRMLSGPLPPCGHYSFPRPILQVCEAIGREDCPDFVVGCYTADAGWKILMCYYAYCLDAWVKEAPPDVVKAELAIRDDLGKDWGRIVEAIYATLGDRTDQRTLLVRRLVHRLRWWIKTLIWSDDRRDKFLLDVHMGDVRGGGDWGEYGDSSLGDPYFAEMKLSEIVKLESEIKQAGPDAESLLGFLQHNHLCGPKVFRNVERLILRIGAVGTGKPPNYDVSILQCEDTYPDIASCTRWYGSFMSSLTDWLEGNEDAVVELGRTTPIKHWLVRMLRLRLRLMEESDNFGKLVGIRPSGRSGTRQVSGHG
jgi:hypothetical protein